MADLDLHAVRARYAEPHRRYHTLEHLDEVLTAVASLRHLAGDPRPVELAAVFHDAVYDPRAAAGENEAASAELARAAGCDDEVVRLVLLTAGHAVEPGDRNGAVLVDADLWILGAPAVRYERYVADVRAEYAHVDDEAWRAGRAAVLRSFLDRERIYATEAFESRLGQRARTNLAAELVGLGLAPR